MLIRLKHGSSRQAGFPSQLTLRSSADRLVNVRLFPARAYMSLFDRYDQHLAENFLRDTCLIPTPQRRFEDLFEQIQQHFQQMQIFSNSDDSLRNKEAKIKNTDKSNGSVSASDEQSRRRSALYQLRNIDESTLHKISLPIDYHNDLFLENISHLLVFNPVSGYAPPRIDRDICIALQNEDPPLRGGSIDALIIRATSPDKKG